MTHQRTTIKIEFYQRCRIKLDWGAVKSKLGQVQHFLFRRCLEKIRSLLFQMPWYCLALWRMLSLLAYQGYEVVVLLVPESGEIALNAAGTWKMFMNSWTSLSLGLYGLRSSNPTPQSEVRSWKLSMNPFKLFLQYESQQLLGLYPMTSICTARRFTSDAPSGATEGSRTLGA